MTLRLSDQALGALMMALQNSLITQTDIVPVLKSFDFITDQKSELVVTNPPTVRAVLPDEEDEVKFVGE
jgi:methylase of polypeptide subunit release factors